MLGLAIRVKIPVSRRLQVADAVGLGRLGAEVASAIRVRVRDLGKRADGSPCAALSPWWPRSAGAVRDSRAWKLLIPKGGDGRWVAPRGGKDAGAYRYYQTYVDYVKDLGRAPIRNFNLTGNMWEHMVVRVRLVWGNPVVVIGFDGSVSQRGRQDWREQILARRRGRYEIRRRIRGMHTTSTHTLGDRSRRSQIRIANSASKAAYQRWSGRLDWFLEPSDGDLLWCAEQTLRHLAKQMRDRWEQKTLSR
jgi:hypothetical protein